MADHDAAMAGHEAPMENKQVEHEARLVEERAKQKVKEEEERPVVDMSGYMESQGLPLQLLQWKNGLQI